MLFDAAVFHWEIRFLFFAPFAGRIFISQKKYSFSADPSGVPIHHHHRMGRYLILYGTRGPSTAARG